MGIQNTYLSLWNNFNNDNGINMVKLFYVDVCNYINSTNLLKRHVVEMIHTGNYLCAKKIRHAVKTHIKFT